MYFAYFSNATQKGTQRAVTTTIFFLVPLQLHIPSMILPCFFSQAWQFCNASSCAAADSQRLEGAPGISWRLGTGVAGCDSRDSAQGTFSSRFASLGFFGDSAAALLVSWKHVETYRYMEAGGHFQTQVLQFRITVKKGCWIHLNTFSKFDFSRVHRCSRGVSKKLFDPQGSFVLYWSAQPFRDTYGHPASPGMNDSR